MNIHKSHMAFPLFLFGMALLVIALIFHTSPAMATTGKSVDGQNKIIDELPPETVGQKASRLLEQINATVETGQQYESRLKNASEEDSKVLNLQVYKLRKQIMEEVSALADALLELEKAGPQPELRKEVEGIYTRITPALWFHINPVEKYSPFPFNYAIYNAWKK